MRLWPGDKDGDGLTPAQGLLNTKCEMLTLVRAEAGALSLSCNSEYHFCWSSHLGPLRWTFRCPQAPKRRAAQVSLLLDRSTNRRITEQKRRHAPASTLALHGRQRSMPVLKLIILSPARPVSPR